MVNPLSPSLPADVLWGSFVTHSNPKGHLRGGYLSPSIHIQILQTDLHAFSLRMSRENLIKDQGIFSWVLILIILITYLLTMYGYC